MAAAQTYNWYAARTRYGQELKIRDRLEQAGIEYFIPVRTVSTSRKGRTGEKAVLNNLVFLRATKADALELANTGGARMKYIIDCATRTLLVVPDKQMEDFMRVLDLSTDGLVTEPLALGDRVRVTKGPIAGVEGNILEFRGRIYVVVGLLNSLFAKTQVPKTWLEKI